jgi:hypothetical protein
MNDEATRDFLKGIRVVGEVPSAGIRNCLLLSEQDTPETAQAKLEKGAEFGNGQRQRSIEI